MSATVAEQGVALNTWCDAQTAHLPRCLHCTAPVDTGGYHYWTETRDCLWTLSSPADAPWLPTGTVAAHCAETVPT